MQRFDRRFSFLTFVVLAVMLFVYAAALSPTAAANEGHTYYIDAAAGRDANEGTSPSEPWAGFAPLNALTLKPGDEVRIAPGEYHRTLSPHGQGTEAQPIVIRFEPGRYDFFPDKQRKKKFHISNSNGAPQLAKSLAIYMNDAAHVRFEGRDSDLYMRGKMMEFVAEHCRDITVKGLAFDYHRPTVSELTVDRVTDDYVDVTVHPDSWFEIEDNQVVWVGEGWRSQANLAQKVTPARDRTWRVGGGHPLRGVERIEMRGERKLRLHGGNTNIEAKAIFQYRKTLRDYAAVFIHRCKNVTLRDGAFHFMHGMGVVSQFTENVTVKNMVFAPREGSGRTCAAWADMLHFSGSRGLVRVDNVHFSGAHDDAMNIHGTYLRIVEKLAPRKIIVRFIHKQTYGFAAFAPGDEIAFVRDKTHAKFGRNKVAQVKRLNARDRVLTLKKPAPSDIANHDVVENLTWTPRVKVTNCKVEMIPTRGFLLTTPRPVVIENNRFLRTSMHGILIASDTSSWMESGSVRDVTIRDNTFVRCAEPVIRIHDANHQGIRVMDNTFVLRGGGGIVHADSVTGLTCKHNRIRWAAPPPRRGPLYRIEHSQNVTIRGNTLDR
jgi:hypothetical protein